MSQCNAERSAGERDKSFGIEGERTLSILPSDILETRLIKGVLVLQDNRILLSMTLETAVGVGQYGLAILTSAGDLDQSFNEGKPLISSFKGADPCAGGRLLRLADGRLLMLGAHIQYSGVEPIANLAIACYSSDYKLDPTFGPEGNGHLVIENQPNEICITDDSKIAEQADGKLLISTTYHAVGDWSKTTGVLYRLLQDGRLDKSFNMTGRLNFKVQDSTAPTSLCNVLPQGDGKIVVAGHGSLLDNPEIALIARLHDNGALDTRFGNLITPGYCGFGVTDHTTRFNVLLPTSQGFLGLGQAGPSYDPETQGMRCYITKNGLPDLNINGGKPLLTKYEKDRDGSWQDGYVLPDGKQLTVAAKHYYFLARWLPDGTSDSSFGNSGCITEDTSNAAEPVVVVPRPDNTFLCAGNPTGVAGGLGKLFAYYS